MAIKSLSIRIDEELLHKLLRTKFRPEFINRLDEIVFFNALSDADMQRCCTDLPHVASACLLQTLQSVCRQTA